MTKLIEANTTIPSRKSQVFSTASDNQPAVDIHVLQGERAMASDNRTLGKFQLTDLPAAQRGIPQIEVTFDIDANGIISVSAKDLGTGKEQNIKIESGSKLSDEEIERMKAEAKENEENDKKNLEKIQKLNEADSIVFQTEKTIKDLGDKIEEEEKTSMESTIEAIKEARKTEDVEKIESLVGDLTSTMQKISERVYAAAQNSTESETVNAEQEENVEFEEVK
jgi:molecular chaperone DnaK